MARPRADDYADKRAAIHRRAAQTLSEAGGRASMSRIAEDCGISKALLYHYYKNRDALISDILCTHLREIDRALAKACEGRAGADRLHCLSRTLLALYEDADDLHRLQLGALGKLPEEDARRIRTLERVILDRFRAAIREVAPDLDGAGMTAASMSLMGMLNWVFTWFRPGGALTRDEFARHATDMLLRSLEEAPRENIRRTEEPCQDVRSVRTKSATARR
ncbi:TetR/AcrR family transcriptional regulator [Tranquillimonas alkanivorans]|uniref:Transcriptional regulator, TetR family n=1 Tax=Tranquillimonas alkanivorans TaxID=441119 RepID=A0A1I5S720_9RHOB|nr:TetR/AcrR family transcriptional regulator [Tranquillimonas alkanivorans]SFP66490.1 transcriptional regulator, TetR family [Tranquillimonas alkanivorans]